MFDDKLTEHNSVYLYIYTLLYIVVMCTTIIIIIIIYIHIGITCMFTHTSTEQSIQHLNWHWKTHIYIERKRERERERDSHSSMPFCFEHSFEFNTAHCFIRNDLLTEGITVALDRLTCEISGQQKKIVTQSYEPLNELLNFRWQYIHMSHMRKSVTNTNHCHWVNCGVNSRIYYQH